MKRLYLDFKAEKSTGNGLVKLVPFVVVLLAIGAAAFWQYRTQLALVESASSAMPAYPDPEEIHAADAAIRNLNMPWIDALNVMDAIFESPADGALLSVEANVERMTFKISGEARDQAVVQAIPLRLKAMKSVADAVLVGQEMQQSTSLHPLLFTLEFRMRDPS